MKEATGEANMTIVTVVLIGIITLIATPIITTLVKQSKDRACCVNNGYAYHGGACYSTYDETSNSYSGKITTLDCD